MVESISLDQSLRLTCFWKPLSGGTLMSFLNVGLAMRTACSRPIVVEVDQYTAMAWKREINSLQYSQVTYAGRVEYQVEEEDTK